MKRILKSPTANAVCISLFSAFYALVFLLYAGNADIENIMHYEGSSSFWAAWSNFLVAKNQVYLAWVLIAVSAVVVVLLLIRRRPYDEYHVSILKYCLISAVVLTLAAIAIFYLIVLSEPVWVFGKFTLFIAVHWTTVVLANLVFVLICTWR